MCDIDKKERKKKYKKLRKAGWNPSWARAIRDYSPNHYKYHLEHAPAFQPQI